MDVLFDDYPNRMYPYDYDAAFAYEGVFEMVVTNCLTGRAEYMTEIENRQKVMDIARASSSMPLAAPVVDIDGIPYLDGGIADSIPIKRAESLPNQKIVIVLTREKGYRKSYWSKSRKALFKRTYREYPEFVRTLIERPLRYNRVMDYIDEQEAAGHIFVIRPTMDQVKRLEKDVEKLEGIYTHGYERMSQEYEALMAYLSKEND